MRARRVATLFVLAGAWAGCGAGDPAAPAGPPPSTASPAGETPGHAGAPADPGAPVGAAAAWATLRATIAAALAASAETDDLTGGDARVREVVVDLAAAVRGDPAGGHAVAQGLLDEPEPAVRDRLAAAVAELHARGALAGDATRTLLRAAAADRTQPADLRCAALRAAGPGTGIEADPVLVFLDDAEARVRRTALEVLAPRLADTDQIRARIESCATRDADPAVRMAALDALVAGAPDARTFLLCAARLVADDGVDALPAAEGLARLPIPGGGVARLGALLPRVAEPAARTLLLHAIVAGPSDEARAVLRRIATDDPDTDVRAVAAELAR